MTVERLSQIYRKLKKRDGRSRETIGRVSSTESPETIQLYKCQYCSATKDCKVQK